MSFLRRFFRYLFTPLKLLLTSPGKLITGPRRLLGLSLPARGAVLMAVFLLVVTLLAFFLKLKEGDKLPVPPLFLLVPLLFVLPLITYPVLKMWLEPGDSAYDDIDRAWQAGLAELERNGLDLGEMPLFLLLGSSGEFFERDLFDAARLSLTVSQFPKGQMALHWYATGEAIYLVASEVGRLSKLALRGREALEEGPSPPPGAQAAGGAKFNPHGGTLVFDSAAEAEHTPSPAAAPMTDERRGTLMVNEESSVGPLLVAARRGSMTIDPQELARQTERLNYLCRLLRRARQPLCPVNGVLALIPFQVVQYGKDVARHVADAVKLDLEVLAAALQIRCPVMALVTGLEEESGFRELVRRKGQRAAQDQRLGKGFKLWFDADGENLEALSKSACGAFEEHIYALYRDTDALTNPEKWPGNRKLFSLLCRVRGEFQTSLQGIVTGGFKQEARPRGGGGAKLETGDELTEGLLLSGLYFAGTAGPQGCQAFVHSVFEKLTEEQAYLEWSDDALRQDARHGRLAYTAFAVDVLLAIAAAVVFYLSNK